MKVYAGDKCEQKYTITYSGPVVPGGQEIAYAYCPNCKEIVYSEMTSQCIHTHKVDDEEKETDKKEN